MIGNDNTGPHNSEEVSIVGAVPLSLYATAGGGRPSVVMQNNVGDAEAANLQFRKSRSTTLGGHTVVQDDDQLGQVTWYASDGDSSEFIFPTRCARIYFLSMIRQDLSARNSSEFIFSG